MRDAQGKPLTPFDIVWKTLLPGWSALTALGVDGRQGQLALRNEQIDLMRLWLWKGNENQGFPAHTIVLRGRDERRPAALQREVGAGRRHRQG